MPSQPAKEADWHCYLQVVHNLRFGTIFKDAASKTGQNQPAELA
jgi:hypothetical protein